MSLLIVVYGAIPTSSIDQFHATLRCIAIAHKPVAILESSFDNVDRGRSRKLSECRLRRPLKPSSDEDFCTLRILGHPIDPSRHQATVRSISETPVSSNCQTLLTATDFRLTFTVSWSGTVYHLKDNQTVHVVQVSKIKPDEYVAGSDTTIDDVWMVELSTIVSTADGEISGVEGNLLQFAKQLMDVTDVVFTFNS